MPNWSAIEASFFSQPHAQQLGELAACLARINSWLQKSANREVVPVLLEESLLYLSLIQLNGELNQLQDLLQDWQQNWHNISNNSTQTAQIAAVASTWSMRVLEMSGLLSSPMSA